MAQEASISSQNKNQVMRFFKLFVLIYLKSLEPKTSPPISWIHFTIYCIVITIQEFIAHGRDIQKDKPKATFCMELLVLHSPFLSCYLFWGKCMHSSQPLIPIFLSQKLAVGSWQAEHLILFILSYSHMI